MKIFLRYSVVFIVSSLVVVVAASPPPPPCSLNGELVLVTHEDGSTKSACVCDKPWTGSGCGILDVQPVSFPQGYGMSPNKTTWGADLLVTPPTHQPQQQETTSTSDGKKYHLFVSAMTGGCSLRSWHSHSRIEHAVADNITGPYQFRDIALPTFAHNPKLVDLSSSSSNNSSSSNDITLLALIHIGDGTGPDDAGNHCRKPPLRHSKTNVNTSRWDVLSSPSLDLDNVNVMTDRELLLRSNKKVDLQGSSTIHIATSVNGPWTPLLNNTLSGCNNPSPFVHHQHHDPTAMMIYVVCIAANHSVLMQAEHIWGPWKTVSQITPFPNDEDKQAPASSDGSSLHYEDPTFYIDSHRDGGAFHVIYHVYDTQENPPHGHECTNSTVSAHLFSRDGIHW